MTLSGGYEYSQVADEQLTKLMLGRDWRLYDLVVDTCEAILEDPATARELAAQFISLDGMRYRTIVHGAEPYKIFWSYQRGVARIEAVFPYPT